MEHATVFVYNLISLFELIFGGYTMFYVSERQSAVYFIRNARSKNTNKRERVKTSAEIEEELYNKFPYLKNDKKRNNDTHLKNN